MFFSLSQKFIKCCSARLFLIAVLNSVNKNTPRKRGISCVLFTGTRLYVSLNH